ncbi:helix-turn-helix domain-containing protein, partial [Brevundimonas nasdae]|uniref:helix-turn-helix domain-containing protein n=1 Tax=Brevundimonas nasdae TaxID=172043 RepID=UPI0028986923
MQIQDEIDQKIGATIRRLRGERGASQAQVASAAGVTFQQVQKYERGVNRVAISTLVPMCKALGRSPVE